MTGEDQRGAYPNMLPASADLWRKWLKLYQDKFEQFYYNVRVGAGVRPPSGLSPDMIRDWWATTALRIDVVGERQDQTWCIEVAERPSTKILGSLQLYTTILPKYQGQNAQKMDVIQARNATDFLLPTMIRAHVIPALICRYLGTDFKDTIHSAGIFVFQFSGSSPPILPTQFLPSTLPAS
jgi:hypothetical protein